MESLFSNTATFTWDKEVVKGRVAIGAWLMKRGGVGSAVSLLAVSTR